MHCTENTKHVFPEIKLRRLVPNFHIHVSVSDINIPTIVPQTQYSKTDGPIMETYKSLTGTRMQKLGTRPRRGFISTNICFAFSVQCGLAHYGDFMPSPASLRHAFWAKQKMC
jgi:hypothetical protein